MSGILQTNSEISKHVEQLDSLNEGDRAVAELIASGPRAIEQLRRFLLEGKPSAIYRPRQRAVEALAGLEARKVLLEYLRQKKQIADPEVRLAEEAVESTAARQLSRWPSQEVNQVLLEIIQERCLPGALEALGDLKSPESIPYLVMALEDDFCRPTAEEALRKIGAGARMELIHAVLTPRASREAETPSSLSRRGSAAGLLAETGISADQWPQLRQLLSETAPPILVAVSKMAARVAGTEENVLAVRRLIEVLETADWYSREEIGTLLMHFSDVARSFVEEETLRRRQLANEKHAVDPVLLTLLRVKHRAEKRRTGVDYVQD